MSNAQPTWSPLIRERKLQKQIAALTAERDGLAEQVAEFCAEAEVVGYYGDRADSAGVCFRVAYTDACEERDRLRKALLAVEWASLWSYAGVTHSGEPACPRCHESKSEGHAHDCIVGLALEEK